MAERWLWGGRGGGMKVAAAGGGGGGVVECNIQQDTSIDMGI